jgi:hypothetical protein
MADGHLQMYDSRLLDVRRQRRMTDFDGELV